MTLEQLEQLAAQSGQEPLFLAIEKNLLALVRTLLVNGANPNGIDERGMTPLELAHRNNHEEIASILREYQAQDPHTLILQGAKSLGHYIDVNPDGTCQGFTTAFLNAWELGHQNRFHQRVTSILKTLPDLNEKISEVREKKFNQLPLTSEEKRIYEAPAFYDSVMLYQSPEKYLPLFNCTLSQADHLKISEFAAPDLLQKTSRREIIYSDLIYVEQMEDIETYLEKIKELFLKTQVGSIPLLMYLHSHNHVTALVLNGQDWHFMDINYWPPIESNDTKVIAHQIPLSLRDGSTFNLFSVEIMLTSVHPNFDILAKVFHDFRESCFSNTIEKISKATDQIQGTAMYLAGRHSKHLLPGFLECGIDVNAQRPDGKTALFGSLVSHDVALCRMLLNEFRARYDMIVDERVSILTQIAATSSIEMCDAFYSAGADLMAKDQAGITPLMAASHSGNSAMVKHLLTKYQVLINEASVNKKTALWYAAAYGDAETVLILLESGAEIDQDIETSPLSISCRQGNLHITNILLEHASQMMQPELFQKVVNELMFFPAYFGMIEMATLILNYEPDLTAPLRRSDGSLITYAQIAEINGHYDVAALLASLTPRRPPEEAIPSTSSDFRHRTEQKALSCIEDFKNQLFFSPQSTSNQPVRREGSQKCDVTLSRL